MPLLLPIDEEMKQWSALLEGELRDWPHVTTKPMFGMLSFYRGKSIFAAVPRTRALTSPHSIIMKFEPMPEALMQLAEKDPRISVGAPEPGAGWHSFELRSSEDLREALWWLNQAYKLAKK